MYDLKKTRKCVVDVIWGPGECAQISGIVFPMHKLLQVLRLEHHHNTVTAFQDEIMDFMDLADILSP
jgi:hypothetical protein